MKNNASRHQIRAAKIAQFDPNSVGLTNNRFIGLPFAEEEAQFVFLPVPWDVTTSFTAGTAYGPQNILDASVQLDLYDPDFPDAWKIGHYFRPIDPRWLSLSQQYRNQSELYIQFLESGGQIQQDQAMQSVLQKLNEAGAIQTQRVKKACTDLLDQEKLVGLIGGDHSCPLGYLQALADRNAAFGVLQIDAHMDLRNAYEGFQYSHASIFHEALRIPQITKLVQVGIRDYCEEELQRAEADPQRIHVLFEQDRMDMLYAGTNWAVICQELIQKLPSNVYVSFDIDGLDPSLCPNTGTPVPGGLSWNEAIFLLRQLVDSGRRILGFDLCETGGSGNAWDGNVGARLAYKMANLCAKSNGISAK